MTEGSTPEIAQRFAIQASPRFKSFAEYERSPAGAVNLVPQFGEKEREASEAVLDARSKWLGANWDRIEAGEFGPSRLPMKVLSNAARQGNPEAIAIIRQAQQIPSEYAELKVAGEIPIQPRDVSAIMLPSSFAGSGLGQEIEATTGVKSGTAGELLPAHRRGFYDAIIDPLVDIFSEVKRNPRGKTLSEIRESLGEKGKYFDPYDLGSFVQSAKLKYIPDDPGAIRSRIEHMMFASDPFATEVARTLTRPRYAEGGVVRDDVSRETRPTRVPIAGIDEESQLQARRFLESLRGFAGAPSRETVMLPGAAEAYESGETGSLLASLTDLVPGIGAAKGLGGLALAGAIRRGGDPRLLMTHNMSGDYEDMLDLLINRRSLSSPSIAISEQVHPFAKTPTILFNPNSPILDPRSNIANQLFNRDAYTTREFRMTKAFRMGLEDLRMTERATPKPGQKFAIQMSPAFRSFAEYEKSRAGRGALGQFTPLDAELASELETSRMDWLRNNINRIASGELGANRDPTALMQEAARRGDLEARAILGQIRTIPSSYAELKVPGEVPIQQRDVSAILFPSTARHLNIGQPEFERIMAATAIPTGFASQLAPRGFERELFEKLNPEVRAAREMWRKNVPFADIKEQTNIPSEYIPDVYLTDLLKFADLPVIGKDLSDEIRKVIKFSPGFEADVARELTRGHKDGGIVKDTSGGAITQKAMLNRLISAYNEL